MDLAEHSCSTYCRDYWQIKLKSQRTKSNQMLILGSLWRVVAAPNRLKTTVLLWLSLVTKFRLQENGLNPGVTYSWKWSSGWLKCWKGLLSATDASTTCADTIFKVKWLWTWLLHRLSKRVSNNSPSEDSSHPDDHFQSRKTVPFTVAVRLQLYRIASSPKTVPPLIWPKNSQSLVTSTQPSKRRKIIERGLSPVKIKLEEEMVWAILIPSFDVEMSSLDVDR